MTDQIINTIKGGVELHMTASHTHTHTHTHTLSLSEAVKLFKQGGGGSRWCRRVAAALFGLIQDLQAALQHRHIWRRRHRSRNLWRLWNEELDSTICLLPAAAALSTHAVCSLYWLHLFEAVFTFSSAERWREVSQVKGLSQTNRSAASHRWGLVKEEVLVCYKIPHGVSTAARGLM